MSEEIPPASSDAEALSHDLRTPLTTIRLVLEGLARNDGAGLRADSALELVRLAVEQSHRLERVIESIEKEAGAGGVHDHVVVLYEETASPDNATRWMNPLGRL